MALLDYLEKTYKIDKEIGRGGMGCVYKATDIRLERKVAIKVLALSEENNDASLLKEIVERFQREAKAIARLSHPNIVNIYDFGQNDEQYYMVMELLDGKDLEKILEIKSKLPVNLGITIAIQICSALDYAHEYGVIHRDIKPANIILLQNGTAKLTDFGIAQQNKSAFKLTVAGSMLGSLMYISPEQLDNAGEVDHRADIYSMGMTLYEVLSGVLPFDAENISSVFHKIRNEVPKPPSFFNQAITKELDLIILKALEKDAAKRYRTIKEMGLELSKLIDNSSLVHTAISMLAASETDDILDIGQSQNDFSWISKLTEKWQTDDISRLSLQQVLDKVINSAGEANPFTGVIVINQEIFLFASQGYLTGAVDLKNKTIDDDVFENLPEKIKMIELKVAESSNNYLPLIISNIVSTSGEEIYQNINFTETDLKELIKGSSGYNLPFTGYIKVQLKNQIFYFGYHNGKQLFSINANPLKKNIIPTLQDLATETGAVFNFYRAAVNIKCHGIKQIFREANLTLNNHAPEKITLLKILDLTKEPLSEYLIKEARDNTYLDLQLKLPTKITALEEELDLIEIIQGSKYYKFANWLINKYFYSINITQNTQALKYIYTWIPAIESFKFFEKLQGKDGHAYEFDLVTYGQVKGENYKKVLMLAKFGNGNQESLEKFIAEAVKVKKNLIKSGDIGGVIYISNLKFSDEALRIFYDKIVSKKKTFGLGSLDNLTRYKGFIRIEIGRGFHLNLVEFDQKTNNFSLIAPLLN